MKADAQRVGNDGFKHTVSVRRHKLTVDEPEDNGGDDSGPSPQELLAASLASCTAVTIEMYAKRKGWDVGDVSVDVDYEPAQRAHGSTTFQLRSLIGLSIEGLTSFSVAPLRLASLLGILLAASALVFGGVIVVQTFIYEESVPGYPSLIVGLMVLGGVQLVMIGIMGEYIGKILSEIKHRPAYFVAEHSLKAADTNERETQSAQAAAE